jgi:tetratricopeptide (TPR) repeat protein
MNLRLTGNKFSRVRTIGHMHRYVSVFVLCVIAGSVFPMGSGTGGGTSGSLGGGIASGGGSGTSQIEEGDRAMRLYDQGIRAMNSKRFTEAQVRFEQALIENPSFAEAHNYLGYLLQMQGPQNYPIALEQYDRAIRLKPDLAEAYEYRAVLLLRINRKTAAEKDLRTLEALRPKLATELERIIKSGKAETGDVVKHSGQIR